MTLSLGDAENGRKRETKKNAVEYAAAAGVVVVGDGDDDGVVYLEICRGYCYYDGLKSFLVQHGGLLRCFQCRDYCFCCLYCCC